MSENSLRLPAVPEEEFIFACQLMNGVIDGNVKTKNPEEYAMQLPDGSYAPLDDSFSARIYLAIKETLNHLDHVQIYSITSRYSLVDLASEDKRFLSHFHAELKNTTDEFLQAITHFPMWTSDTDQECIDRLHKYLTRKRY